VSAAVFDQHRVIGHGVEVGLEESSTLAGLGIVVFEQDPPKTPKPRKEVNIYSPVTLSAWKWA